MVSQPIPPAYSKFFIAGGNFEHGLPLGKLYNKIRRTATVFFEKKQEKSSIGSIFFENR